MLMPPLSAPIVTATLLLSLAAAISDLRTGKIPNLLTLSALALAPLVHGLLRGPGALGASLLGALLCALVPLMLFARSGMGGGDVKLFAALGALLGTDLGLQVQFGALVMAAFYACIGLVWQGRLLRTFSRALRLVFTPKPQPAAAHEATTPIRLGASIFLATLLLLAQGAWPWLLA